MEHQEGSGGMPAGDREARVRARAYEIWERAGCPEGMADEHWQQAEAEVGGGEEGPPDPRAGAAAALAARDTGGPGSLAGADIDAPAAAAGTLAGGDDAGTDDLAGPGATAPMPAATEPAARGTGRGRRKQAAG